MTRIIVRELVLNEWTREHIKKHSVTDVEITTASNQLIYHKRTYKGRFLVIGRSGTRLIGIVLRRVAGTKYAVVTARDAGKKERRKVYEKEKQNSKF